MMFCECQTPPFHFTGFDTVGLGDDAQGAEVSLLTCRRCGLVWLKYLIEEPHHSNSGRWWRVIVPKEQRDNLSIHNAREFVQRQQDGFVGGSYFSSTGMRCYAPINVG